MASNNKGGLYYWVGGLAFLIIAGMAVLPRLLGKAAVVAPPAGSDKYPGPTYNLPQNYIDAIKGVQTPMVDYGVANSQYGRLNNYNFAGVAIEQPTTAMPLGFHLNNIM